MDRITGTLKYFGLTKNGDKATLTGKWDNGKDKIWCTWEESKPLRSDSTTERKENMVVVNNHESRVATVRVERRLPNRKNTKLWIFIVPSGQSLDLRRMSTFPIQVGQDNGSVPISSDLEVEVYL